MNIFNIYSILRVSDQIQNTTSDQSVCKLGQEDSQHLIGQIPSLNTEEARTKQLLQKVTNYKTKVIDFIAQSM